MFEEEGALDKLEAFTSLNGPQALPPAAERGQDRAGKDAVDGAGRGQGRGRRRTHVALPRRRDHRVAGGGVTEGARY